MSDFTTLFAETLNTTIAKMVAEAVAVQYDEMNSLKERVKNLEWQVINLVDGLDSNQLRSAVENIIENYDFSDIVKNESDLDSAIENIIENYDFSSIVNEAIDPADGLFEGREFSDAVKDVIASALQR